MDAVNNTNANISQNDIALARRVWTNPEGKNLAEIINWFPLAVIKFIQWSWKLVLIFYLLEDTTMGDSQENQGIDINIDINLDELNAKQGIYGKIKYL